MDNFINDAEKLASVKLNAINFVKKNKGKIAAGVAGAGALGGAYSLANDKQKEKIKDGLKFTKNSLIAGSVNGGLQSATKYTGLLLGTGIGLKKGKSLGSAIASNGLAGLAIGDIAGAATIPTVQLYSKHKKEFGKAPDAKSLGTVVGANLLPTAAIWGSLYGTKKGLQNKEKISKGLINGMKDLSINSKNLKDTFRKAQGFTDNITPEMLRKAKGKAKEKLEREMAINGLNYMDSLGGAEGFKEHLGKSSKKILGSALGMGKAFAPIAIADELAGIPAALAAPQNIIDIKKKQIEKRNKQDN